MNLLSIFLCVFILIFHSQFLLIQLGYELIYLLGFPFKTSWMMEYVEIENSDMLVLRMVLEPSFLSRGMIWAGGVLTVCLGAVLQLAVVLELMAFWVVLFFCCCCHSVYCGNVGSVAGKNIRADGVLDETLLCKYQCWECFDGGLFVCLFKLNRVIIVKLSREFRVNLGQNIAYELTLSNKR